MPRITVLGASAMGSALCRPLSENNWDIHLWGTEFDNKTIDLFQKGQMHPATQAPLPGSVRLFRARQLDQACRSAEVLALAVASVGLLPVTRLALPQLARCRAIWLFTKGFVEDDEGQVLLLAEAMKRLADGAGLTLPPIISVAGPVIARQCALGKPTATVFACPELGAAVHYARAVRTESYRAFASDDGVGIEVLAPLKNVYAIALGATEGFEESTGMPQSNLRAAVFAQAISEMSLICEAMGGKKESAIGLAGVGDLEVTGISGRNKFYGRRLGRGEGPVEAHEQMRQAGQTVEGVATTPLALKLVQQRFPDLIEKLPLLQAISEAVAGTSDIRNTLVDAALPAYPAEIPVQTYQGEWSKQWDPRRRHLPWGLAKIFRRRTKDS